MRTAWMLPPLFSLLAACASAPSSDLPEGKKLTTGVVQRDLKIGMTGAGVAEALGSPNIVSTDENGCEVWIYERFAREVRSRSNDYWVIFVWGRDASTTQTQRSLTVIVKFDKEGRVRDVAYHATSF